jgi:general secretion pathway protein N
MSRRRSAGRRSLVALLLLACILGAGLLALEREYPNMMVRRLSPVDAPPPAQPPDTVPGSGQPVTALLPAERHFAVVALRPLFTPGRRPPERPATPGPVSRPKELPAVILTGIVMAGTDSLAIIEHVRTGAQSEPALTLRVGDTLGGWVVETIAVDRLVLVQDDERRELELKEDETRRRPVQPRKDRKKTAPQQNLQPPRVVQPAQPNRTE